MKDDLKFRTQQAITFDDYDANMRRQMYWSGQWVQGTSYEAYEVVLDTGYLMSANKTTLERPAPQTQGDEYLAVSLSDDEPPEFIEDSIGSAAIYFGQRYNFTQAQFIRGLVFYIPNGTLGMEMAIYLRTDPLGTPAFQILIPAFIIQATDLDRWVTIPVGELLITAGSLFDVVAFMRPTAGATVFTYNWDYVRNNGDPLSGQAFHQNNNQADLRFHEEDFGGTNRSSDLDNIGPGSNINMAGGLLWSVTAAEKIGQIYHFDVNPASRAGDGVAAFEFTFFGVLPIPFVVDLLYWTSVAQINGIYSPTGDVADEVVDETLFGIDLVLQGASISEDWDVLAHSAEGGSASAGGAPELSTVFAISWIGQATNGLCVVLNEYQGVEVERTALGKYTLRFAAGVVEPATVIIPVTVATGVIMDSSPELRIEDVGSINVNEILINSGIRNKGGVFTDDDLIQQPTNFMAIIGERYN